MEQLCICIIFCSSFGFGEHHFNSLVLMWRYPTEIPDAYERLVLDAIEGERRLFIRSDELDAAWALFTPLLKELEEKKIVPELYPYGSRGPVGAHYLAAKYNVRWGDLSGEDSWMAKNLGCFTYLFTINPWQGWLYEQHSSYSFRCLIICAMAQYSLTYMVPRLEFLWMMYHLGGWMIWFWL